MSTGDAESREWLQSLSGDGPEREDALRRLHALLLHAARAELARRRPGARGGAGELDDLAMQAADDALVAILGKLNTYRGESRFTTWAYKFGLLEAGVRLRRRAWQEREVVLEPEAWPLMADSGETPHGKAEASELMAAVSGSIDGCLTGHQREVVVGLTLNGVPLDVLADRLGTTRGALYKTLHDARKKLRAALVKRGF